MAAEAADEPAHGSTADLGATAASMASAGTMAATLSGTLTGDTWKPKKKRPGATWDGRASSLTLQEYRDKKWSLEACNNNVMRRAPSWSVRPMLPRKFGNGIDPLLKVDVFKSIDKTKPSAPSFSMGAASFYSITDRSPGPSQYNIPSIMDPKRHPTCPKIQGYTFPCEIPLVNDEEMPAPGQYSLDKFECSGRIKKMPVWKIQGREAWSERTAAPGPVPGEYDVSKCMRTGPITGLKWSLQGKTEPLDPPRGERRKPPPGADYDIPGLLSAKNQHVAIEKPPMWKFGRCPRGL